MAENPHVLLWATAISKHESNGRQIIFRFAQELDVNFNRASQPNRVIIAWKYESDTGMPVAEEQLRMNHVEDAVESILAQDHFATLALVSSGQGLREWTYYARSEDEFLERFNLALHGMEAFPIEIHTAKDPEWRMYQQFVDGLRETVH